MIKLLEVYNQYGDHLVFDFNDPCKTGLILTKIDGLGPGKASINTIELATTDGAIFNSARVGARNIVLTLLFDLDHNAEDMRLLTYRFFSLKHQVKLKITTDTRISNIEGYVESNEPGIFDKWEGTQISIICPDPFFHDVGDQKELRTEVTTSLFEIPYDSKHPLDPALNGFSNESLTEKLIEFGSLENGQNFEVKYNGDAEVGVKIEVVAEFGPISGIISFENTDTNKEFSFDISKFTVLHPSWAAEMLVGDKLIINTRVGQKKVSIERNGYSYNMMNCVSRDSEWFMLHRGKNSFTFHIENGAENAKITFINDTLYEGT